MKRRWKVQFSENGEEYYGHLTVEAVCLDRDPVNNKAFFADGVWVEIDEHIVSVEEIGAASDGSTACLGTNCPQWRHHKPCCGKEGRADG